MDNNSSQRLRNKARKILESKSDEINKKFSDKDLDELIEEISVFQVELELQNDELRSKQRKLKYERRNLPRLIFSAK